MPLDRTGILLGIIGAAMFSTKPIFIKFIYEYGVDASTLMALRMAFSLPFYLVLAVIVYRQRRRDHIATDYSPRTLGITAIIGIFGYYIASFLDLEGLTRITAQFERLILFTYPVFVAILSTIFLGTKITRPTLVSLALTYTGLFVIFSHDISSFGDQVLTGALMVLAAAAVFAGYVVFSKDLIDKLGSRLFTCFAMIAASIAILVHFTVLGDTANLNQPWPVYAMVLAIAIIATVLPTFFLAEAIARIGPGPTSILGSIGPIFTPTLAVLVLGEAFTVYHFIGTAFIIVGIVWLTRHNQRPA